MLVQADREWKAIQAEGIVSAKDHYTIGSDGFFLWHRYSKQEESGILSNTLDCSIIIVVVVICLFNFLIGQAQDNEKELAALFQLWLETKDQAFCKVRFLRNNQTFPIGFLEPLN